MQGHREGQGLGDGFRGEERYSSRSRETKEKGSSSGPPAFLTHPKVNWFLIASQGHWAALQKDQHGACHSWLTWLLHLHSPSAEAELQRLPGLSCYRGMWCHQTEKLQKRYWAARCMGQCRKHRLAPESGKHDMVDVSQG